MRKNDILHLAKALKTDWVDAGDNVLVCCPFAPWRHKSGKDRTPSLSIKVNDHGDSPFHCFGCEEGGRDLDTLVLRLQQLSGDREQAMRLLDLLETSEANLSPLHIDVEDIFTPKEPVRLHLPPPTSVERFSDSAFTTRFGDTRDPLFARYCRKRGLKPETVEQFGLGFDRRHDRLVIPVRWHTGEIVGAIGRLARPPVEMPDGRMEMPYYNYWRFPKSLVLFGEHLLTEEMVVVCEGPFDAIKVRQAGFNSVAVMGAKFSEEQAIKLIEWGQPVLIFFDPDDTGETQANKLARRLKDEVPVQVTFPPPGKDAGSLSSEQLQAILGPFVPGFAVQMPNYWRS